MSAAGIAVAACAAPERFAPVGSVADGMKPWSLTWFASHVAAARAAVVGSLLACAAAGEAGAATSNSIPTATERMEILRIGSSLGQCRGQQVRTARPRESSAPVPQTLDGETELSRRVGIPARSGLAPAAYGCGSAPDFDRLPPHDAAPLDHPVRPAVKRRASGPLVVEDLVQRVQHLDEV